MVPLIPSEELGPSLSMHHLAAAGLLTLALLAVSARQWATTDL